VSLDGDGSKDRDEPDAARRLSASGSRLDHKHLDSDETQPLRASLLLPPPSATGTGPAQSSLSAYQRERREKERSASGLSGVASALGSGSGSRGVGGGVNIDLRRSVGVDARTGWNNAMPDDVSRALCPRSPLPFFNSNPHPMVGAHPMVGVVCMGQVFVHAFSFLEVTDVVSAARVNSGWHQCAQEPTLWKTLDLSRLYNKGKRSAALDSLCLDSPLSSYMSKNFCMCMMNMCSGRRFRVWVDPVRPLPPLNHALARGLFGHK
jgi:hypothetical protein